MATLAPSPPPTASNEVKIRIRDLSKSFDTRAGRVIALDKVSLDIPTGCFFMIVGPSGCGKTTLLRILAKLETPTTGTVDISAWNGIMREKMPTNITALTTTSTGTDTGPRCV